MLRRSVLGALAAAMLAAAPSALAAPRTVSNAPAMSSKAPAMSSKAPAMKTKASAPSTKAPLGSLLPAQPDLGAIGSEHWVSIPSEKVLFPAIDQLGTDLHAAQMDLKDGNTKAAAQSVRLGAAYLRSLPENKPQVNRTLEMAAKNLDRLAKNLDADRASIREIGSAFRSAENADLSGHWARVSADEWKPFFSRVGDHLARAVDTVRTDSAGAARDLRAASAYLRIEGARGPSPAVAGSRMKLELLASQIDSGKIKDPSRIEVAIRDTGRSLAEVHYDAALADLRRKDEVGAKREFQDMVEHLKLAAKYAGATVVTEVGALDHAAKSLVVDTKAAAEKARTEIRDDLKSARGTLDRLRGKAGGKTECTKKAC